MDEQVVIGFLWNTPLIFKGDYVKIVPFCGSSSAVERRLPKPKVAGSNPVSRSSGESPHPSRAPHFVGCVLFCTRVYGVEVFLYC